MKYFRLKLSRGTRFRLPSGSALVLQYGSGPCSVFRAKVLLSDESWKKRLVPCADRGSSRRSVFGHSAGDPVSILSFLILVSIMAVEAVACNLFLCTYPYLLSFKLG